MKPKSYRATLLTGTVLQVWMLLVLKGVVSDGLKRTLEHRLGVVCEAQEALRGKGSPCSRRLAS